MKLTLPTCAAVLLSLLLCSTNALADRIKDLTTVAAMRSNQLSESDDAIGNLVRTNGDRTPSVRIGGPRHKCRSGLSDDA